LAPGERALCAHWIRELVCRLKKKFFQWNIWKGIKFIYVKIWVLMALARYCPDSRIQIFSKTLGFFPSPHALGVADTQVVSYQWMRAHDSTHSECRLPCMSFPIYSTLFPEESRDSACK
jgi:hypothetical protein